MLIAYKAFEKNLKCRDYQYKLDDWNETSKANCAQNGFHCAENPLDCLSYYSWDKSVIYRVVVDGDIDEDSVDTKISCTRMKLLQKLNREDFLRAAVRYMYDNPQASENHRVRNEASDTDIDGMIVVRGKDPMAKGKTGTTIALLREEKGSRKIRDYTVFTVDGSRYSSKAWYRMPNEGRADG